MSKPKLIYDGEILETISVSENSPVLTTPRKWSEYEEQWAVDSSEKGYSIKEIAHALGRSETSVSIKMKRLKKKTGEYNERHREDKYLTNDSFMDLVQPKTVFDVFSGKVSYYSKYTELKKLTTNDIDQKFNCDYNLDYLKALYSEYLQNSKYDLIDLDPFGSAFDGFDTAIKMAQKGLIITFGELGHLRWKRLDFVRRYYGIESLEDFTIENMITEVQKIGLRNKKKLIPVFTKEWFQIGRVYFTIEPVTITEQWDNKEEVK